ncbi:MAG TPA: ABC transporter permease, partial [Chloroflexota bacterium]
MSVPKIAPPSEAAVDSTPETAQVGRRQALRRRVMVNVLRLLFAVVIIGGWEIGARSGWIDSFFWGEPSKIWAQIVTWAQNGTAQGPLWEQIYTTLKETVLGFLIGTVL